MMKKIVVLIGIILFALFVIAQGQLGPYDPQTNEQTIEMVQGWNITGWFGYYWDPIWCFNNSTERRT